MWFVLKKKQHQYFEDKHDMKGHDILIVHENLLFMKS